MSESSLSRIKDGQCYTFRSKVAGVEVINTF